MLRVERLRFQFPGGEALLFYDFEVAQGQVLGILGPSGAGKSTLFNLLAGFEQPLSGRMSWFNQDFGHLSPGYRPISLLFQSNNLFEHKSVLDNLRLGGASRQDAIEGLAQLNLADLADRMPGQLSGGQQQRVGLVRSLISERPILMLDEPFSGLDQDAKNQCLEALDTLRELGKTLLFISHDASDLKRLNAQTLMIPQQPPA